jgi:hypothetical protein
MLRRSLVHTRARANRNLLPFRGNQTNIRRYPDGAALSRNRDAPMREGETVLQFLERALPPDGFVFWPTDRS